MTPFARAETALSRAVTVAALIKSWLFSSPVSPSRDYFQLSTLLLALLRTNFSSPVSSPRNYFQLPQSALPGIIFSDPISPFRACFRLLLALAVLIFSTFFTCSILYRLNRGDTRQGHWLAYTVSYCVCSTGCPALNSFHHLLVL